MAILSDPLAKHFVSLYNDEPSLSTNDVDAYLIAEIENKQNRFSETDGTLQPIVYLLMKEAESSFFLGLNNFVRGLEILGTGLGNWAHVTFYYSSFYSAKSILALYGGWSKNYYRDYWVTQVDSPDKTNLTLKIIKWKYNGRKIFSHKAFWSYYFDSMKNITYNIPPKYHPALSPMNSDVFWMTETRNKLNYQINDALKINSDVLSDLDTNNFPYSLPQEISIQYNQAKNFILLSNYLLNAFNIDTDVFNCIGIDKNRNDIIKECLYERVNTSLESFNLEAEISL